MSVVAVIIEGKWTPVDADGHPQTQPPANLRSDRCLVDTSGDVVEQIVAHLGQVVRLAQNLSPTDARRVRDFVHAASSMLSATTYLTGPDQARFEQALRDKGGR